MSQDLMSINQEPQEILNELSSDNEPGLQYIVVNKSSVIYEKNIGLSDVKMKIPLSEKHTLAAFSMTKTLTAIAILQLVEKQKLTIDDKVSKYIEHPYNSKITIRQLLNHTSGIPNPIPLKWVHLSGDHHAFDENKALKEILGKHSEPTAEPNTKYIYSNIGYWLLGEVIEKVTDKEYSVYIIKNIFEELGLTEREIGFIINSNQTKGYLKRWSFMNIFGRFFVDKNTLGKVENGWIGVNNVYLNGASFGGVFGSAKSFSIILQDLLSKQSKLLGETGKELLYSQQKIKGSDIDMTLGWHIGQLDNDIYYYKEGGGAGFHCEMRIYPKQEIASVLMVNRTSFNTRKILSQLDIGFVENKI
jgi:CubicO group peptidase (beta-lactamase class C family)